MIDGLGELPNFTSVTLKIRQRLGRISWPIFSRSTPYGGRTQRKWRRSGHRDHFHITGASLICCFFSLLFLAFSPSSRPFQPALNFVQGRVCVILRVTRYGTPADGAAVACEVTHQARFLVNFRPNKLNGPDLVVVGLKHSILAARGESLARS